MKDNAIALARLVGYSASFEVENCQTPFAALSIVHFLCTCFPEHRVCNRWGLKFERKPVAFLYSEPYSQLSATLKQNFSTKVLKKEVDHIIEFSGFSTTNKTPCSSQALHSLAQKSYSWLADWTFAWFNPLRFGSPSGNLWLRRGRGCGAPFCRSFLLIGILRAADEVPHGGAIWMASTLPDATSLNNISWTQGCFKSICTAAALSLCRLTWWSMPIDFPPAILNWALTPAVPQNSSINVGIPPLNSCPIPEPTSWSGISCTTGLSPQVCSKPAESAFRSGSLVDEDEAKVPNSLRVTECRSPALAELTSVLAAFAALWNSQLSCATRSSPSHSFGWFRKVWDAL